jgi:hypothetical protein
MKRASWYVNKYAGGINRDVRARKSLISIEYPNGEIRKTSKLLVFQITPKVRKGSIISVGVKPEKEKKIVEGEKKERQPIDWERVITSTLSLAVSAMTVLVLSKQL